MNGLPAISLIATPGRRRQVIDAAVELERLGFPGIYCPSLGDALTLCADIATRTSQIEVGTAIQPIYLQHPVALAGTAAHIHETSGGRFKLGIGVTHGPVHDRLGITPGRPLADIRDTVARMREAAAQVGELPPIVLATLRRRMVELSVEIADGAVWANGSRSAMAASLAHVPAERRDAGFFVGNMIPTVVDEDREAAAARNRKTLAGYVMLPNYRNYWKEAGYVEEMESIEQAIAEGDRERISSSMTDAWLADCTLYGSASEVRDGVEAWREAGVTTPILVPSSTSGGQLTAVQELSAALTG
ncbi:MAG: LLM class flavin-dependent oxidoreductase [Actinomycetota bacterium]|nr:LLM class flavin-dependent oxidoreductase [Actinomycetota bacterium]